MLFDRIKHGSLDYCLYRYGNSKNLFRGPKPDFTRPYCVFLGSSETYGKFVPKPFTNILQKRLGMPCANFSALNAGVEMYLKEPSLLLASASARVTVIAVIGAHNMSNRFYSVHPHRNDRFVRASNMLKTLFREVDFSEIHYTRHLLSTLRDADALKFRVVAEELKAAWTARMKSLLEMIEGRTVLLWMADHPPPDRSASLEDNSLAHDPLFIDQEMMDELSPLVTKVVECIASPATKSAGCAKRPAVKKRKPAAGAGFQTFRSGCYPGDQSASVRAGTASNRSATSP